MATTITERRLEIIRTYFLKVDEQAPSILDLFTADVQIFFPKFGVARGKAALGRFSRRIAREVAQFKHDIDGLLFTIGGDRIVVEGQELGVTPEGISWPDGVISQGRFCNVFEFQDFLISRLHIYVDPDFTNQDERRIDVYRGGEAS